MKSRILFLLFAIMIVFSACSKKSAPPPMPYEKGSEEYEYLSSIKDKTILLDPDVNTEIISTKKFSIYSGQVIPFIYPKLKRYETNTDMLEVKYAHDLVIKTARFLAEKQVFVNAAKSKKITVEQAAIDSVLNAYYKSMGTEEAFYKDLNYRGMTKEFFLQDVNESLMIKNFLDQYVYGKIPEPTEEQLLAEYNKEKTATFQQMLMKTGGKTDEEKKEIYAKMQDLLQRAKAGEDLDELIKNNSEDNRSKDKGGLYTNVSRGIMLEDFENVAFSTPVGEFSDVFETEQGYHFIKVIERKKEKRDFKDVKNRLQQALEFRARHNAEEELREQLKKEYNYKELVESL